MLLHPFTLLSICWCDSPSVRHYGWNYSMVFPVDQHHIHLDWDE